MSYLWDKFDVLAPDGRLLKEIFLDADNFQIQFSCPDLDEQERSLILAAGVFIDLQYFESKGSNSGLTGLFD